MLGHNTHVLQSNLIGIILFKLDVCFVVLCLLYFINITV